MTAWILNATGLLATTVGALLIFLYLCKKPRFADVLPPEAKSDYARHRKLLTISVGLLCAWLLIQYLALILI